MVELFEAVVASLLLQQCVSCLSPRALLLFFCFCFQFHPPKHPKEKTEEAEETSPAGEKRPRFRQPFWVHPSLGSLGFGHKGFYAPNPKALVTGGSANHMYTALMI